MVEIVMAQIEVVEVYFRFFKDKTNFIGLAPGAWWGRRRRHEGLRWECGKMKGNGDTKSGQRE